MNKQLRIYTLYNFLLGSLLLWSIQTQAESCCVANSDFPKETWITVFVHGIMSIAPHLNIHNFSLFMCDDIVDTVYARTVNLMRKDPFFYTNQAMQKFGIHQIDPYDLHTGNAPAAIARTYDEVSRMVNPNQTSYYYTYGWSGLLSITQRYQEAEGLLIAINQLVQKYKMLGVQPKIRVIGYSHGGNVCLNIAAIHRDKYPDMDILIDELTLIGMPVQVETDYLTDSPIFKEVYHIYSSVDRIQQIDFFSFNRFFSDRIFKTRKHFKVPDKLTQINLKITRLRTTAYDKTHQLEKAQDFNQCSNISGQRRLWRDASPGHIELWFLGWIPGKYRENFPLSPLPCLTFVPLIINELKKRKECIKPYPVIVDIRPEVNVMLIKQRKRNKLEDIAPFISHQEMERLKSYAYAVEPEKHNAETYSSHIAHAFNTAQEQFDEQKREVRSAPPQRRRYRRFRRRRCDAAAVDRSYQFTQFPE